MRTRPTIVDRPTRKPRGRRAAWLVAAVLAGLGGTAAWLATRGERAPSAAQPRAHDDAAVHVARAAPADAAVQVAHAAPAPPIDAAPPLDAAPSDVAEHVAIGSNAPSHPTRPARNPKPRVPDPPPPTSGDVHEPTADESVEVTRLKPKFDIHHFDPRAYFATAAGYARAKLGPPHLNDFLFFGVRADGTIDLTTVSFGRYTFVGDHRFKHACSYSITVRAEVIEMDWVSGQCGRAEPDLACSLVDVRRRAGVDAGAAADVTYEGGHYYVDWNAADGHKRSARVDHCP